VSRDRAGGHSVYHPAGTASYHHNTIRLDALYRQTERMDRPTLLEKRSTADNLCHRSSSRQRFESGYLAHSVNMTTTPIM
jgi:hypothetical protein